MQEWFKYEPNMGSPRTFEQTRQQPTPLGEHKREKKSARLKRASRKGKKKALRAIERALFFSLFDSLN
jgi:hypothetical protein